MEHVKYDVIVVGAGPAGVTAAAGVARTGASVLLLEGGAYAGAENWSGCVFFAENLTAPDAFGPDCMDGAPFERRLVRRGIYMTDGETLTGISHQDPDTFNDCYTVLRPAFDPYWAEAARKLGATYLPDTTVTSLIRRDKKVVGVHTDRGPVYADIVFLAEGDASHLVRYEGLERVTAPDFMQGVKAVYSLPEDTINQRFDLNGQEGAANEFLVRNLSMGGRTLKLNMGAFCYTNKNSLSVGYVVSLKNMAESFTGNHEDLLGYITGLPGIAEQLEGATLSAFGAKLIRTGGVTQSPILVENGLAVGGSACGLGIDVPYPNFTGPASATGLCFARAFTELASTGQSPTSRNLTRAYLERLRATRYWADAQYLSKWPDYLEKTDTLFGMGVDITCGTLRYLTAPAPIWKRTWLLGRFLRDYLKPRQIGALIREYLRVMHALRMGKMAGKVISPSSLGRWALNTFSFSGKLPAGFSVTIRVGGEERGMRRLPVLVRGMVRRILPAMAKSTAAVYKNDDTPLESRMETAVRTMAERTRLLDVLLAGIVFLGLVATAVLTILVDLFRYYVMKTPAEVMLNDTVTKDTGWLRERRSLEGIKPSVGMAERLATNTYVEGATSHIRVLWPEGLPNHASLSEAPYWSICPAGVYGLEPAFTGHGTVAVNFENCVKCESCWQAESGAVLWGRHTDHQLIYRPETPALDMASPAPSAPPTTPAFIPVKSLPKKALQGKQAAASAQELAALVDRARRAFTAFEMAVANVPPATDHTRTDWPVRVGESATHRLRAVQAGLSGAGIALLPLRAGMADSPFSPLVMALSSDADRFSLHLRALDLFEAVGTARRIRDTSLDEIAALLGEPPVTPYRTAVADDPFAPEPEEAALREIYPDTRAKKWDANGLDDDGARALSAHFATLPAPTKTTPLPPEAMADLKAWGAIHVGIATLGLAHLAARAITGKPDGAAVDSQGLSITRTAAGTRLKGELVLVPARLSDHLVITDERHAHVVPLKTKGVKRRKVGAGGLHPAGFETITLDITIPKGQVSALPDWYPAFLAHGYATMALGASDYLARRSVEQAVSRIQFPGQMQDTAGRDGVAKFGAVKALVARILSWRALLTQLTDNAETEAADTDLLAAIAAMAFCPKNGRLSYDAGQTFGGTGYSEDDLLSRFYRDSAVFPHLAPGSDALTRLAAQWGEDTDRPLTSQLIPESGDTFAQMLNGPLAGTMLRWQKLAARVEGTSLTTHPAREALALTIATCQLACGVQTALDAGQPVEGDTALIETLLNELEQLVATAANEHRAATGPFGIAHFPELPEVTRQPLAMSYAEIVGQDDPYASGDFLKGAGSGKPQFIPEVQLHDPALREIWEQCYHWFLDNCTTAPDDGGPYERYMERLHTIPPEMLEGFIKNNYFASVVPARLDGLGWKKVGYYMLVSGAMRFGDASLSLLIMASTSIGTTPVLLGMEKEIPLIEAELGGFEKEPEKLGAIKKGLDAIVEQLTRPDPGKLQRDFTRLMEQVDHTIRKTKVTKYLAQNFMKAFYGAGLAGKRKDFAGFAAGLKEARELFAPLSDTITAALAELPLRKRAHELFLTQLGNGGVAAFALTEPSAGSDSGGVTTVAHLNSAKLEPLPDGRYRFEIRGEERFLIDSARLEYTQKGLAYRLSDDKLAYVSTDSYDYATDQGTRTLKVGRKSLPFHDIAHVRNGNRYEFYEVTGAKMWITNGRVATQFSMYVKTDEGITGLMVDRHTEGLIVGRDEEKMGQQGSPTNELAIDLARVPRECVIGYEGHGQVNALETLNVGRCGLAVASVVMGRRLLVEAKQLLPQNTERDRVLAEVAARIFANESLCYHLIGRFDNKSTSSVRMESAVAKYVCSEMFHDGLDRVEGLFGARGQTRDLLVEKMRRDARILNIYEGTNEVQRFLIIKELCGMVAGWEKVPVPEGTGKGAQMARYKETLRRSVSEAVATLGDAVWLDAAIQTPFFPLAEMAGELYLLDATLYRLDWLSEHKTMLGADYTDPMLVVGERAADQCLERLEDLHARYLSERPAALASRYPVEAVASDAAMEPATHLLPDLGALAQKTAIVCLIRPVAVTTPTPRIDADGVLTERVWRMNPTDEHALATALAVARGDAGVTVHAVSSGAEKGEKLLQEALAAGCHKATLLPLSPAADPAQWAAALKGLATVSNSDLILCGAHGADMENPLGAFLSGRLGRPLTEASALAVSGDGKQLTDETGNDIKFPVVVTLTSGTHRVRATVSGHARALAAQIEQLEADDVPTPATYRAVQTEAEVTETATTPDEAARFVHHFAEDAARSAAAPYSGKWGQKNIPTTACIWTVAQGHEARGAASAFRAARQLGTLHDLPVYALAAGDEAGIRKLAGLAKNAGIDHCFALDTAGAALSVDGRSKVLETIGKEKSGPVRVVAPAGWESALAQVAGKMKTVPTVLAEVNGLESVDGGVRISRPAYGGGVEAIVTADTDTPLLITSLETAEFPAGAQASGFGLAKAAIKLAKSTDLDPNFTPPKEDLTTAEVVVDVGYGAGSPDGMALAEELLESLQKLGLSPQLGATRKITQGLGLLPQTRQIGQTGLTVNPRLIFALGISGAPQHVDYIGTRASVIAFNKDAEAPLMSLNRPGVTVHPVTGDLFETVPQLIAALKKAGETKA